MINTWNANVLAYGLCMCSAMCQYIGTGEFMLVSSEANELLGVNPIE